MVVEITTYVYVDHHHPSPECDLMDERRPDSVSLSRRRSRTSLCCDQRAGSRIVAKIIPVLLVGAAGFATWVFIAQICGMSPTLGGQKG